MEGIINGIRMAYDDTGSGTPVLLIHGFPFCRRMWHPQVNALVPAGYRVVAPDLRGFGDSDAPDAPYGMEVFADDLVALLDHLGIETAIVGGMSMGGYVLLNMLERYPTRISAACFLQTRPNADDDGGRARRLQLAGDVRLQGPQVVADAFLPLLFSDESRSTRPKLVEEVCGWMVETATSGLVGGLLAMRERKDYTPLLPGFSLPALAIGGGADKIVPAAVIRQFGESMPRCRTTLIPGVGHMANLEAPNDFNRALLSFLGELSGISHTYECC